MRGFTVHVKPEKLWPSLETPVNTPPEAMDSRLEWIGQRFLSMVYVIGIFTFGFAVSLSGLLYIVSKISPPSRDLALDIMGTCVLGYFISLPCMLGYGYWITFLGSREELNEVWKGLPWIASSELARE